MLLTVLLGARQVALPLLISVIGTQFKYHFVSFVEETPAPIVLSAPAVPSADPPPKPSEPDFPADLLLDTIRNRSVHRGQVDWSKLEPELRSLIAKAKNQGEKARAVTRLFEAMNDVHSHLEVGGKHYSHHEGLDEATRSRLLALLERERAQASKVTASTLPGKVGYLLVPSMAVYTPEQVAQKARELRESVAKIAASNPRGWVVDLRLNGGGNLYPMLVGLAPLLGEGVVGGTIDAEGRMVHEWVLKPDGLYWRDGSGDRLFAKLDLPVKLADPLPPVAVLLGPITRSSGQATALAFKGRPRTILLGEPTAKGYTTTMNPFAISPTVTLSLAVGYMTDRKGVACKSQVLPEETVQGGDALDALDKDQKVQAAIAWLKKAK